MEGFGVTKDLNKAEELLLKANKMGNAQSSFQLYMLYSQQHAKIDAKKAYKFLTKACQRGVTYFEQLHKYFVEFQEILGPVFSEIRKIPNTVTDKE